MLFGFALAYSISSLRDLTGSEALTVISNGNRPMIATGTQSVCELYGSDLRRTGFITNGPSRPCEPGFRACASL
jgi:hypothetical protein